MKNFDNYLKLGAVILVVLVAIWFWGRSYAKHNFPDHPVPDNPTNDPDELTDQEKKKAENLADDLYEELDGWNAWYDTDVFESFSKTTDRVFIATYNQFNDKYYNEAGKTLKQWINSDLFHPYQLKIGNIMDTIYKRFDKLIEEK